MASLSTQLKLGEIQTREKYFAMASFSFFLSYRWKWGGGGGIKDGWGKMKRGKAQDRRQGRSPFQEDE